MPNRLAPTSATCTLIATIFMAGCSTLERPDPLETMNRKVFAFNEAADKAVVKPVATVYARALPAPARTGITNFFSNVGDLWSATNLVLQARPADGLVDAARFGANSTIGLLGFIDIATPMGLARRTTDFGRTLGHWGMPSGAYVVLPLLGPSSVRDSIELPVSLLAVPQTFVGSASLRNSLTALQFVNQRADLLPATRLLDEIALDKYSFVRDAYLQRRQSLVDGAGRHPDDHGAVAEEPAR